MSEPDVASSDPTNLETTLRRDGDWLVLNGRKWFITGAAHPRCKLLIVMCRNHEGPPGDPPDAHRAHSIVLVPIDTPGVRVVRNIPVVHHLAPEGTGRGAPAHDRPTRYSASHRAHFPDYSKKIPTRGGGRATVDSSTVITNAGR